jgi:hypothetical protein
MSTLVDKPRLCVQPPGERTDASAPSGADPAQVHGPLVARGDGVQESEPDTNSLGHQLLAAIKQVKATLAAPTEPMVIAPAPPTRDVLPASPFDIEAALAALEQATTEEEAMAAVNAFVDGAETVVNAAPDPFAALTTIFGSECVDTVTAVCAAAVVDLEAEAAATGGSITERAGIRIARSMVDRVTMRAGRTRVHAARARLVPRARTLRAPRARRAPRRAVRLAAVASAGDGPPPPPPSHAPIRAWACKQPVRAHSRRLLVAQIDDVVERIGDLRERDLTSAPRTLLGVVVRRHLHLFRISLHGTSAVRLEALAKLRRAATRPRSSLDQVQRLRQALDAAGIAGLVFREIELANRAERDGQRAEGVGPQRRPAMAGNRDAPRSALDTGGAGRSARAPRRSADEVIATIEPTFALVLIMLARDALRDEMRVVGDTDPLVPHPRWPCAHSGPRARSRAPVRGTGVRRSISYGARCSMPGWRRTASTLPTINKSGTTTATTGRWRGAIWCRAGPTRREGTMTAYIPRAREQIGAIKTTVVILVCVAAVQVRRARRALRECALAAREV